MSGLEAPAFIVGLASLFSTCVDAFGYFKLAQHADKAVEVVLLKLDIEKTRLLIWGDNVGVFSAGSQNPQLLDERVVHLIERILTQIESLLTDSEKLRATYGVRNLDAPLERAVDYISRKSHLALGISMNRFWTRNSSKLSAAPQGSRAARIKWAVYEREKFQELVNNLSDLVDSLFELVSVAREIQDRIIIEDIESIFDISHLAIIEEATDTSHRAYSQAAASTRALTEAGTVDRRTLEERLKDTEGTGGTNFPNARQTSNSADLDLLLSEVERCDRYFVLTGKCRKLQTQNPCDIHHLGSQAGDIPNYVTPQWDISSRNEHGGRTLWQLIDHLIGIRSEIERDIERPGDEPLGAILKAQEYDLSDAQRAYMTHKLPLLNLFIYCAPCVCLIHTAISLGKGISSPFLKVHVRPDDRLLSSCCVNADRADRALGLSSTLEKVREWESWADETEVSDLASFLDSVWLDRRLDHLNHEQPYNYNESAPMKRILVIGEADYLASFLLQKAPGQIPVPTDIWVLDTLSIPAKRYRFGRFVERGLRVTSPHAPVPGFLTPVVTVIPPQVQGNASGAKRSPSPLSSDGKRQRSDAGSIAGGSRDAPSEDENMKDALHASEALAEHTRHLVEGY